MLDPTLDAEVLSLPAERLREMFRHYKAKRGAKPKSDIEPSEDQLSALAQVTESGFTPYADFAIWGKHGKRMLQKLLYTAFVSLPDGSWQRRELPGPPNYAAWYSSWRVLRTALLLLDIASAEVFDQYADRVRDLVELYREDVWFLVYLADQRMQTEEFPGSRGSWSLCMRTASPRARLQISTPRARGTRCRGR